LAEALGRQSRYGSAEKDGDATDDGNFAAVLLVAARPVEQPHGYSHRPQHQEQGGTHRKRRYASS
jgi:hypothetical protein